MATTKTYTFVNGQPADGTQVNQNFDDLLAGINANIAEASVTNLVTDLAAKAPLAPTGDTYPPSSGAQTVNLNVTANNMLLVVGNASGTAITFTITGATGRQRFVVQILQGTVVSTITAWFTTIRWAGGTAPTLTATPNKRDTFEFIRTGTSTYDGFVIGQNA